MHGQANTLFASWIVVYAVWIVAENSASDDDDAFCPVRVPMPIVDPAGPETIAMVGVVMIRAVSPGTAQ